MLARQLFTVPLVYGLATGCMSGPGLFKQSGVAPAKNVATEGAQPPQEETTVLVPTRVENGVTLAAVSAASDKTQVVKAPEADVVVPPGALAVDAEIGVKVGESLLSLPSTAELLGSTGVTSAGTPVTITSSVPMDTLQPFSVILPLPQNAALALEGAGDPYANLVVLYSIHKEASGEDYAGILARGELAVVDDQVTFSTRYFGTYQAVVTKEPVLAAEKVAPKVAVAKAAPRFVYFVRGPVTATFGEDSSRKENFQGWGAPRSRGSVLAVPAEKLP